MEIELEKAIEERQLISGSEVIEATSLPPSRGAFARYWSSRRARAFASVGLFLLGMVAFLYFGRVFLLPIVLAVILNFLLKPVVKLLARVKVPQAVGAALVLMGMLLLLGNGVTRLSKPAADFIDTLPDSLRRLEAKARSVIRNAEQLTKAAARVEDLTQGTPAAKPVAEVKLKRISLVDTVFSATTSFLAGALETIVLLYFLLADGEVFMQKLVKVLPSFREKQRATEIVHEVQQNISTFLFTISVINACLGVLVGLGIWLVGLNNPILWGVTAALLNFIPYFGPIAGVCVLAFAGLMTFDSTGQAFVPPLIYISLHVLESNFITPRILGRRLTLNPLIIFVSLMFWTWLWGIPGALLSVPLLMTLKILCDHYQPLEPIGEFIGG